MFQTLFYIPHEFIGFPLFGIPSWSLVLWGVGCLVAVAEMVRRGQARHIVSSLPTMVIVALVLGFLLPHMEIEEHGEVLGIAIRGYGTLMLVAFLTGVATAMYRATQVRLDAEIIVALATWMFVGGIVGARLFFMIQKWDEFQFDGPLDVLVGFVNLAKGGLVVYGSFFGALLGMLHVLRRYRLPMLPICDLIAASMLFGLAIGRIGCLMNGCCYGGVCDHAWCLTFPRDSPPFDDQLHSGRLHGFTWNVDAQGQIVVRDVVPHSRAAAAGLASGNIITAVGGHDILRERPGDLAEDEREERAKYAMQSLLASAGQVIRVRLSDGSSKTWEVVPWPTRSLPVHPTQIYSAVHALLLGLLLWFLYPLRSRDGQVFALLLTCYSIGRFVLETIRTDEGSFAGTGLTISQNVCLVLGAAAIALWCYLVFSPNPGLWTPACHGAGDNRVR